MSKKTISQKTNLLGFWWENPLTWQSLAPLLYRLGGKGEKQLLKKAIRSSQSDQITSQSQKGITSSDRLDIDSHICSYHKWIPPLREPFSLESLSLDHHQVSQQMWGARSSSSVMSKCRFFLPSCDMEHVEKNSHCTLNTSVKHSSVRMVQHSMDLGSIKETKRNHHREKEKLIKKEIVWRSRFNFLANMEIYDSHCTSSTLIHSNR